MARQAARQRRLADEAVRRDVEAARRREAAELCLAIRTEREMLRAAIRPGARRPEDSRQEKELYLRERQQEVREQARLVRQRWRAIQSILTDSLAVRTTFFLDDLRVLGEPPDGTPPSELLTAQDRPSPEAGRDGRTRGLAALVSIGRSRSNLAEAEPARIARLAALAEWTERERLRLESLTAWEVAQESEREAFLLKQRWRGREIESIGRAIVEGEPAAIATYAALALERSLYPEGFPRAFDIGFDAASGLLVVEMSLPDLSLLPQDADMQYIAPSDQIVPVPMRNVDRKAIHGDVIAMIALRTIHEIDGAVVGLPVTAIGFNGFMPRRAWEISGPPHCLVSIHATMAALDNIDIDGTDPKATVRALGGVLSRPTDENPAVAPIVAMPGSDVPALPAIDGDPPAFRTAFAALLADLGFDGIRDVGIGGALRLLAFDDHPLVGGRVLFGAVGGEVIGAPAIGDFLAAIRASGAVRGVLVSDGSFSLEALQRAETGPMELVDGAGLKLLARMAAIPALVA